MPRFSIVIPVFNAEATIAETLNAIAAQTVADWEVILVDDGSTDGTAAILRERRREDSRLRAFRNPGKGPSAARNFGVSKPARGDIIAFCDADDMWEPEKLARLDRMFADPSIDAAYGQVAFFPGDRRGAMRRSTVPSGALTAEMLMGENPVCTMSNLSIRRSVFRAQGGLDETMVYNEDLDFLIRLVTRGIRIVGDPALHIRYRTDNGGLSSRLVAMRDGRRAVLARAKRSGLRPSRAQEAVFLRHLARRALRTEDGTRAALRFALEGLATHPRAFLSPVRRGLATAVAALVSPALPRPLRRALFAA
jgi:glycosyltransferase involved in cell wall biosynthesis